VPADWLACLICTLDAVGGLTSVGDADVNQRGVQHINKCLERERHLDHSAATSTCYCHSRSRVVDPDLRSDHVESEAKPERDSEKLLHRQIRQCSRREEGADDGSDGGDRQPQGERANHPFAMASHLSSTDTHEGLCQSDRENDAKQRRGGPLRSAPLWPFG
jgi:hypothetical protein